MKFQCKNDEDLLRLQKILRIRHDEVKRMADKLADLGGVFLRGWNDMSDSDRKEALRGFLTETVLVLARIFDLNTAAEMQYLNDLKQEEEGAIQIDDTVYDGDEELERHDRMFNGKEAGDDAM